MGTKLKNRYIYKFNFVETGKYFSSAFILASCLSSCFNDEMMQVVPLLDDVGDSFFNVQENSEDASVIFFDDDNFVNENGDAYTRPKRQRSSTIGSSDCYMVKLGTTELLVDGGYQTMTSSGSVNSSYNYYDEYVKDECEQNLLRKIASVISDDGILDYLIVTHADYDHIASFIATGGIFDSFLKKATIKGFDGRDVTLKGINYIIDFDSGLVKNFSDEMIGKEKRLIRSDYYQAYVNKRNELIDKGTQYCPASALFDNENLKKQGVEIVEENRKIATPDAIVKRLAKVDDDSSKYILDENYSNGVSTIKNNSYGKTSFFSGEVGKISKIKMNDNYRFYYSLKFGDGELRILYNWHYDYIFHSSFNRNDSGSDSSQTQDPQENVYDSQDANNISVCFQVIKDGFKFSSFGDLGGNGENSLLKYYEGTNVLSDTSVFKASHHGSAYNGENSERLFKTLKPKVIVITGCASFKRPEWSTSNDDMIVSSMVGRTKISQALFDNISSAFSKSEEQPYVLCTNIASNRNVGGVPYFESVPFYGDIKVRCNGKKMFLSNSYVGKIYAYVSQSWNAKYRNDNGEEFSFETRNSKTILKFQETDWFRNVGLRYGEGEDEE